MNSDSVSPGVPRIPGLRDSVPGAAYKKGDVIGKKYEVHGILGEGGFGVVYLVYSRETKDAYALKTFRDEYMADYGTQTRFRNEALVWVGLDRHPNIVRAHLVDKIEGRHYIALEYVPADERGLNSLEGHLRASRLDPATMLRWSIQVCHGMEHAYSKGIRCHRDIKPANILVSRGRLLKVSDFGLAGVIVHGEGPTSHQAAIPSERRVLTMKGTSFGTPTYMPPEQFAGAASCDVRSDIYSFGVVMYQMAASGRLPFWPAQPPGSDSRALWAALRKQHEEDRIPRLQSPVFPVIERCMAKQPTARYSDFSALRAELDGLLYRMTGKRMAAPVAVDLSPWELGDKGASLIALGHHDEALSHLDAALRGDPHDAFAWLNKSAALHHLGKYEPAVECIERALAIEPHWAGALVNKGMALEQLGRHAEAAVAYEKATAVDERSVSAWSHKGDLLLHRGNASGALECFDAILRCESDKVPAWVWRRKADCLIALERFDEAIPCLDRVLGVHPEDAASAADKGTCLGSMGSTREALECYEMAIRMDEKCARAWGGKATALELLGDTAGAVASYERLLELGKALPRAQLDDIRRRLAELKSGSVGAAESRMEPGDWVNRGADLARRGCYGEALTCFLKASTRDPRLAAAWYSAGMAYDSLGRCEEAVCSYSRALDIDATDALAWGKKGADLLALGRCQEALDCCDRAVKLSNDYSSAWANKGASLAKLGRRDEAVGCYDRALELDPRAVATWCNRGNALGALGRYDEAVASYDRALSTEPEHADAWDKKGLTLWLMHRPEEAIGCLDKALALNARLATAWYNKAACLEALERMTDAAECYAKALVIDPRYDAARKACGICFAKLGRNVEAARELALACTSYPDDFAVWFVRALAEDASGQRAKALASYRRALNLSAAANPRHVEQARQRLRELGEA